MSDDPTSVDWAAHYSEGTTPWDCGEAHPELAARLASGELLPPRPGARALVPGCGRGHDALALAMAGWCVTALDLVASLDAELGPRLAGHGGRFAAGDALAWEGEQVDLLFDHTFFCAIDPLQRPGFGALAGRSVAPGGSVVSLLFPVGKSVQEGGPPHAMDLEAVGEALGSAFSCVEHAPVQHAVAERNYAQEWARFVRSTET